MENNWTKIRQLLSESSGVPEEVIDYRASHQVITLYVHGKGLQTISNALNLDIDYIEEVLLECFGEIIHRNDLSYSPYITKSDKYLDISRKYGIIIQEVEQYE